MLTIIACMKFVHTELLSSNQQKAGAYTLNPYDLYMLTQLMEIKKKIPCRIIGITMGPQSCMAAAQKYIPFGLDDIYLVSAPIFSGSDTYATAYILSQAIKHIGQADIYAFGEKSIDGETSQVPIGVASLLELPCYVGVESIHDYHETAQQLNRIWMNHTETLVPICPYVVSFRGFMTKEPIISLLKLKQCKDHLPVVLNAESFIIDKNRCGQKGSKSKVIQTTNIVNARKAIRIEGDSQDKIRFLRELLIQNGDDFS